MDTSNLNTIRSETFLKGTVYCSQYLDDWQERGLIDQEYRKSIEHNNDRILNKPSLESVGGGLYIFRQDNPVNLIVHSCTIKISE